MKKGSMRTTMKDLVESTGFSKTTISQILNGKGDRFPETTKKAVFDAVKELDYRPNQLAVGLTKKETKTIGLIISDIRNVFFSNLAKGIEDKCRENGWNLILCNTSDMHERDLEYIKVLTDKGVDGIIYGMSIDSNLKKAEESLDFLKLQKVPYVMIDRTISNKNCLVVKTDHETGGYLATRHLVDLGHSRIACITGPPWLKDNQERLKGYRKALEEGGVTYDPELIIEGKYTFESGRRGVDLLKGKEFSAIFAFNDLSAYGVYSRLKELGVKIPSEVSLVGYDDQFFSTLLDVPLTSVFQPSEKLGARAVELILECRKEGRYRSGEFMLGPHLTVRESTCRYPSGS